MIEHIIYLDISNDFQLRNYLREAEGLYKLKALKYEFVCIHSHHIQSVGLAAVGTSLLDPYPDFKIF